MEFPKELFVSEHDMDELEADEESGIIIAYIDAADLAKTNTVTRAARYRLVEEIDVHAPVTISKA